MTNPVHNILSYPHPTPPEGGQVLEVAPGILWIRMPLPFALNHVNLWALDDGEGWAVIDAGLGNGPTQTLWEQLLAGPLAGKPVKRLVITHFHPDHIGSANWLVRRTGASVLASRTEMLRAASLALDTGGFYREVVARFYASCGLSESERADMLRAGSNAYSKAAEPPPLPYKRLQAQSALTIGGRRWEVLIGQGHSPEMVCLFAPEEQILIAGDQVLPQITPNVSVFADQPEADPLAEFLSSLLRFHILPEETFVLPSHGLPFYGLWHRLDSLQTHHNERLETIHAACAKAGVPQTAADILRILFRPGLDPHQMGFALGESVAHINYMLRIGRFARQDGEDGVARYIGLK